MKPSYIWVLNPDCERELAAKQSYAVRSAFMARIAERRALFDGLVQGEPTLFTHEVPSQADKWVAKSGSDSLPHLHRGCSALLWCPTPHAVGLLAASELAVPAHPRVEVLRLVHDKRFVSTHLSDLALPGRCIIESSSQWEACRAGMTRSLRTKRPFGYAGKGQRVWSLGGKDDPGWLRDSLEIGGFIVEPNLPEADQLSMHGYVDDAGIVVGRPCQLSTDRAGAPTSVEQVPDDVLTTRYGSGASLKFLTLEVARRLSNAGYWGPFGIDVLWVDGAPQLIDLNPRFTLGWSIGMGSLRSSAIERALAPTIPSNQAENR